MTGSELGRGLRRSESPGDEVVLGAEGYVQFPVFRKWRRLDPADRILEQVGSAGTDGFRPGEVHVWRFDLDACWREGAVDLLSQDELDRARRYRFGIDRRRYISGRAVLRTLLGRYLGREPRSLAFSYGPQGKPELSVPDLAFNLSHSGSLALLGVGRFGPLGVDVERIHAVPELEAIARQTFSEEEAEGVLGAPASMRSLRFFQCWTRKEAFVKAVGGGLSIPLTAFEVSLGARPALLSVRDHPWEARHWSMREVVPGEGFVAAVASRTASLALRCFVWPPSSDTRRTRSRPGAAEDRPKAPARSEPRDDATADLPQVERTVRTEHPVLPRRTPSSPEPTPLREAR